MQFLAEQEFRIAEHGCWPKSPASLYNTYVVTMEVDLPKDYNHKDAAGFNRLNAM